jgi:hypothetical protein
VQSEVEKNGSITDGQGKDVKTRCTVGYIVAVIIT